MNDSKLEYKVGLFMFVGLALLAALVLNFSRGVTLFQRTYKLNIIMPTVAGLKSSADVMMAGVPVGKIGRMELDPDGRTVSVTARMLASRPIRKGSVFHIDAMGFLGDQYIEITPPATPMGPDEEYYKDGDTIQGQAPYGPQEAVRSAAILIDSARKTMIDIDTAVTNVNRTVLSQSTLADFTLSLSNIEALSESAITVVQGARSLLTSNQIAVAATVTNLQEFSVKLNLMADEINGIILTNRAPVNDAVQNFRDTAASMQQLAADLQAGRGMIGGLLKDEQMKAQTEALISNANAVAVSFSAFGSNLNSRGIWSMLWRPRNPPPAQHSH